VRIGFGPGAIAEVGGIATGTVLIVTSHGAVERGLVDRVTALAGETVHVDDSVRSNPTIDDVDQALGRHHGTAYDWVIGLGGGSAIDVAKVLSIGLASEGTRRTGWFPMDPAWAEVQPVPLVAVPTTAGTGSEVTPFATVWDSATRRKHSVGAHGMYPKVALVDPELTSTLPWDVTLSTGLDAYSQCFEAILNRRRTGETTEIAMRGLALVPEALRRLNTKPSDMAARSSMSEAALRSGLAISTTRTGLAHSMSYPLTAHLGIPHGLACALCLLPVLRFNAEADDGSVADVAAHLGLANGASLIESVEDLFEELGVREVARSLIGNRGALSPLASEMFSPERADNNMRSAGSGDIERLVGEIEDWLWGPRS
jgi:alcohol dehydrogenase